VQKYEQLVEDMRAQLRLQDVIPTHEDGLTDMFLNEAQRGYQNATIDRLTRYYINQGCFSKYTSIKLKCKTSAFTNCVNDMLSYDMLLKQPTKTNPILTVSTHNDMVKLLGLFDISINIHSWF